MAVARVYLAAARHELSRLSDPETHDIADEILVEQEIIVQHYMRLADEAETTLLSLENAIIENDQEAISGYNAAMIALVIQSGQLADAMSSLGLKEFRETEEVLRSERAIRKPDLWYRDGDHAVLMRSNLVCHDVHFDPIQPRMRPI